MEDLQHLKTDLLSKFDGDNNLIDTPNSEIFSQDALYSMDDDVDSDNEPDDIIPIHMQIRDPIENLRKLLEDRLGITLSNYPITLQNTQLLDPLKNLVEQCVNGEGIVQINAQIKFYEKRINIYDVLQPINEYNASNAPFTKMEDDDIKEESESKSVSADEISSDNDNGNYNDNENENELIKWVIDAQFKNDQARLKIPDDPNEWTVAQVKHWLQWAVRQFNLTRIKLSDWCLTGNQLCEMEFPEFQKKVPFDDSNVFWTHIELLRKCRFVAVLQRSDNVKMKTIEDNNPDSTQIKKTPKLIRHKQTKNLIMKDNSIVSLGIDVNQGNRSGNNGQIQLWQFLLEILTDHEHRQIIHWIGGEGEFKFVDPEKVAQLWGERKNKPTMNYEKLSRALRYYYDGDMISKVHGKRFVYKFVCNLQQLIGYNAQELSNLVNSMNL